jgi:hypothetical protein
MTLKLQIVAFCTQKQMVVDIWESDDRRLLLKCLSYLVPSKAGWDFGRFTFRVYEVAGSKEEWRNWDLTIAVPPGCRVARPCINAVDFLTWEPEPKD